MEENASKAVFLGVSVFIAIITITIIINFYESAKNSASVANRYDVSNEYNKNVNAVIGKDMITGLELRYLLNYFEDNNEFEISVYESVAKKNSNEKLDILVDKNSDEYWSDEHQAKLDELIKPNYNYSLDVKEIENKYQVIAVFQY